MPRQTKQQRIEELEAQLKETFEANSNDLDNLTAEVTRLEKLVETQRQKIGSAKKRDMELRRMIHRAEEHINQQRGYMMAMMDLGRAPVLRESTAGSDDPQMDSFADSLTQGVQLVPGFSVGQGDKPKSWWGS